MSSAQHLRDFIRERLTAAAQEIFTEVEKTIICYEEELDAQRRMMGINLQQQIKLNRIGSEPRRQSSDLQQPHFSIEEKTFAIQQVRNQGRRSSHDQEESGHQWTGELREPRPPCIKEEDEDPKSPLIDEQDIQGNTWIKEEEESEPQLIIVEKKEPDYSVLQHEQHGPEHLPTRQDQNDLCSSQEGQHPVQRLFVALMDTSTLQEDGMSDGGPQTEQLSFRIFPVVESKDKEGSSSTVSESHSHNEAQAQFYRTHTCRKPFLCETCGKSFTRVDHLNFHKKIHTGEKPFSCETCEKRFSRISHLRLHKKIHTGDRPFFCDTCGKSFIQSSDLNVHRRIHTNERPFSCQTCGKSFTRKSNLNVHRKTHTQQKSFSCQTCGQHFLRLGNLISHMKLKHNSERETFDSHTQLTL
ncbi:zinc finger protein with KRAB and SCAN domains 1-like [Xiphophorus couchianus]|uniref:zinc finger protein with KRAB and SCAN domains 1-like n=1 Tax=Xiphophorus couchianus TaxID=32473 RepID=UPI0010163630|nr:zinc finger protein with KRAB and SCAN domains 1-like [Xiphophorus couchianus]